MPTNDRKYLTITALAAHLSISRSTVYRWILQQRLPQPIYLGLKSPRFCSDELQSFIQAQRR